MKKTVVIFNQTFTVECDEQESVSIDKAQTLYNDTINSVKSEISNQNRERILLMAGLLMAQQLIAEQDDNNRQISSLIGRIKKSLNDDNAS